MYRPRKAGVTKKSTFKKEYSADVQAAKTAADAKRKYVFAAIARNRKDFQENWATQQDYVPFDNSTVDSRAKTQRWNPKRDTATGKYNPNAANTTLESKVPNWDRKSMINVAVDGAGVKTISAAGRRAIGLFGSPETLQELLEFHQQVFPGRKSIKTDEVTAFIEHKVNPEFRRLPYDIQKRAMEPIAMNARVRSAFMSRNDRVQEYRNRKKESYGEWYALQKAQAEQAYAQNQV